MPTIKLNRITYENFKIFKSREVNLDGNNATATAANQKGKTTLYDGFLWLLFDKDSEGNTKFDKRPKDEDGQFLKGLVVAVEAELLVNGVKHIIRKEEHERTVKGQVRGYTNSYKIDGMAKLEKDFKIFKEGHFVPEDKFKILTDLSYFCGKLSKTDRRRTLVGVAGRVGTPAGFKALLKNMNGKSMADYEKMQLDDKKAAKKERDEINPRIDELQLGLKVYAQGDNKEELQDSRESLKKKIDELDKQRGDLLAEVKSKQELREKINHLTCERLHRETIVKNQSGAADALRDERAELERVHGDKTHRLVISQAETQATKTAIDSAQLRIDAYNLDLQTVRAEYSNADSPDCSLCGQAWPADKPKPGLADIQKRGSNLKAAIDGAKLCKEADQKTLNELVAKEEAMVKELTAAEAVKNARIDQINEAIKNRPEPDPADDAEWSRLTEAITKLQTQIGAPVSEQLTGIEAERNLAAELLTKINEALAQVDNIAKSNARITELEAREKELAQQMADFDKELDEIDRYKVEQSNLVQVAVNSRFKHVKWKLFDYYLSEGVKEVCEATFHGKSYASMSGGERMFCGIDIINTLSDYYGISVPLFVDNAESMTLPIEAESQVIRLKVVEGVTELQIVVEEADEVTA